MKTLIIIPTYNERENIEALAQQVTIVNQEFHVLVVDDNSPDGTGVSCWLWERKTVASTCSPALRSKGWAVPI
jgi:hypothetical protein